MNYQILAPTDGRICWCIYICFCQNWWQKGQGLVVMHNILLSEDLNSLMLEKPKSATDIVGDILEAA